MKLATPEDFSPPQHPLDMLEQAVEDNGWPFERSARDEINLSVAGRWCDYHFCFTWREDLQALHVSVSFDMRVSRERRSEIAELLMSINAQLWLGHFDLWSEDGTVLFRHVLIFPDSRVSACANARRCFTSRSKPASIITRPSSSCSGAASRRRKPWRPPCWNARARLRAPMMAPASGAVLLIGAGRMGGALIKGWIAAKSFSAIHVVEPLPSDELKTAAAERVVHLHAGFAAEELPPLSSIVLAVKPQVLKSETTLLGALGKTGALILSIAAGITTKRLMAELGPRTPLVRAMPNTPGAIGQGITVLYGAGTLRDTDRALAEALMASLGETLWLTDETLMDAVVAVSGSGPACCVPPGRGSDRSGPC